MTIEDISKYAYSDEMPNTTLTAPELLLWYQLRDVYDLVKSGQWTRGQGQNAKEQFVKSFELHQQLYEWHDKLWKRIEYAAKKYTDDPCIETADAFYKAVYGVGPIHKEEEQNDGPENL
jgi:hypothetical protein